MLMIPIHIMDIAVLFIPIGIYLRKTYGVYKDARTVWGFFWQGLVAMLALYGILAAKVGIFVMGWFYYLCIFRGIFWLAHLCIWVILIVQKIEMKQKWRVLFFIPMFLLLAMGLILEGIF